MGNHFLPSHHTSTYTVMHGSFNIPLPALNLLHPRTCTSLHRTGFPNMPYPFTLHCCSI